MKKTKKIVLWGSFGGIMIYLSLFFRRDLLSIFHQDLRYSLDNFTEIVGPFVFLFPIIFLFSLITYKMREEVFCAWFNFTKWWIPISIFLTLITPGSSGGGFGIPSIFDKEFLAFILSALFFIISLVIIVRKSLKLRGK